MSKAYEMVESDILLAGLAVLVGGTLASGNAGGNRRGPLPESPSELPTVDPKVLSDLDLVSQELSLRREKVTQELLLLEKEREKALNFIRGPTPIKRTGRKTFQAPNIGKTAGAILSGRIDTPLSQFKPEIQRQVIEGLQIKRRSLFRRNVQLPAARESLANIDREISLRNTKLEQLSTI